MREVNPIYTENIKLNSMASNKITLVEELDASKDLINMKVRIIRRWINQVKRLEMVLVDEQGGKIQCTVKKELVPDFNDKIKEDDAVIIKRFGVGVNDDPYPVVKHKLKCNFYKSTELQQGVTFAGPAYAFSFCPFNEITLEKHRDKDILNIDVIGCVSWCGNLEVFTSKGGTSKKINMELTDLEGRAQRCTLWNDYAVQFNEFVENNKSEEHVITIMQHAVTHVSEQVEMQEVSTVKLAEESQGAPDSKDAFSVTGDSLVADIEKDSETSPLQKRANDTPGMASTSKGSKRLRKPKIY